MGTKFYEKNSNGVWVKVVPKDIVITPQVLAYWYMDDGSKRGDVEAKYLCTDSFTKDQLEILRKKLNKN